MTGEFRPAARRELAEAVQWYLNEGGAGIADDFREEVGRALRLLTLMPRVGTPAYEGVRLWPLKRFPYTLVYRERRSVIAVIAVAHQSREPEYWRRR